MGKLIYTMSIILIMLSGCSNKKEDIICTVVYDSNEKQVVYDGSYLYDYKPNQGLSDKRLAILESTEQAKYLITSIDNYTFTYILPGSYKGTYDSGCGYINYLKSIGYKEEKHEATSEYYDTTLHSEEGRVRVIILDNDQIKIFYENSEKIAGSPPYINGKRGNN